MAKKSQNPQQEPTNVQPEPVGYQPQMAGPEMPGGMSQQQMQQQMQAMAMKIREQLEGLKARSEGFVKEVTSKYKKEVLGMILLPPRPQQFCVKCNSENVKVTESRAHCNTCSADFSTIDLLVLANFEGNLDEKMKKKEELDKKLRELAGKKLDVNISSALLDEVWDMCLKGKYEILNLITIGVPIYDTGWLGALKAAEVHKRMVLQKFEKYVVSYVLAGSLVKGTANKDSDIDTFIVIDDTDVTRMTAAELVSKLRAIIWGMAAEAGYAAGVGNKLNVQIYVLTEMWNTIKAANPVIFTFLRDGIPLYDRGLFTPWKLLLKQGKITPTPEAIDTYMKSGKQMIDRTKFTLKNIAVEDFFWATLTPSQGALMMLGVPPPDPKETPVLMREHFVKTSLLEDKWVKILEDILQLRKDIEHGKVKDVSAKLVDEYLDNTEKYLARLDKLMKQIEVQEVKREIKQLYEKTMDDALAALKMVEVKAEASDAVKQFEKNLVAKKLAASKYVDVISRILELNKEQKGNRGEIASLAFEQDRLAKDTFDLIRAEKGKKVEKFKISATYGGKKADIWMLTDTAFVVLDTTDPKTAMKKYKITEDGSLSDEKAASLKEVNDMLEKFAGTPTTLTRNTIDSLKKLLGQDVKLVVGA
ncbi:MAG: nucleotidyltransferase domain-containing protein [DPANN group archaeon]|nr:nucleotidyltransferase domain-containing protein [DPANN group archaeon]